MGLSSGAGELNAGRGIGLATNHFYGGTYQQFQHLEAAKSKHILGLSNL